MAFNNDGKRRFLLYCSQLLGTRDALLAMYPAEHPRLTEVDFDITKVLSRFDLKDERDQPGYHAD